MMRSTVTLVAIGRIYLLQCPHPTTTSQLATITAFLEQDPQRTVASEEGPSAEALLFLSTTTTRTTSTTSSSSSSQVGSQVLWLAEVIAVALLAPPPSGEIYPQALTTTLLAAVLPHPAHTEVVIITRLPITKVAAMATTTLHIQEHHTREITSITTVNLRLLHPRRPRSLVCQFRS